MALSIQELADLKARVQYAHHHGFHIAKADEYVTALGGGVAPDGVVHGSPAHLLALMDKPAEAPAPAPVVAPVTTPMKSKKNALKAEVPPPVEVKVEAPPPPVEAKVETLAEEAAPSSIPEP